MTFLPSGARGVSVEVKVPKDLIARREFWIQSGRLEHVEGCNYLGN